MRLGTILNVFVREKVQGRYGSAFHAWPIQKQYHTLFAVLRTIIGSHYK